MNINEEKEHLYSLMRDITSERRKLTDMYFGLKERLDDLIKLEQRGLEDLSIKGYVDLYNKTESENIARNMQREMSNIAEKVLTESKEEEKYLIPKDVISEQRFADTNKIIQNKTKPKPNKRKSIPFKKIKKEVVNLLQENGAPMKMRDLMASLNDKFESSISKSNFQTNLLPRIIQEHPRVEKASHGFYQYNTGSSFNETEADTEINENENDLITTDTNDDNIND